MNTAASPCDPARDRAISYMELVFHVKRLVDEGRLSQDDGCATLDALRSALGSPDD